MIPGLDWLIFDPCDLVRRSQTHVNVAPECVAVVNILLLSWHLIYKTNGQGSRCVHPKGPIAVIVSDSVVLIA